MSVPLSAEPVFWFYVKEVLSKHELPRFYSLRHIASDVGRGRAWLRCALNEHSLQRYLHMLLADRSRLRYPGWASAGRGSRALGIAESDCPGLHPSLPIGAGGFPSYSPCWFSCAVGTVGRRISARVEARKGLSMAPVDGRHSVNVYYYVGVGCRGSCHPGT